MVEVLGNADAEKYQRSALGEAQALRIAGKVRQAVYHDALYLDPSLTLFKLAEHIDVSAQYLSQTLNQTLQHSFYDYINEAQVDLLSLRCFSRKWPRSHLVAPMQSSPMLSSKG